ncbi:MAG: (2Fe-2S) ferredoxin domain-containing protein [Phycisphaerae bacterium]|nr:(2Fe-2S) ferredoxin domain-containing protein [Phycisphaerae bacterium]
MNNGPQKIEVVLCMGSSCFARGNNLSIQILQESIQNADLSGKINLKGSLCEGDCNCGPHITIDGTRYQELDYNSVVAILEHHLKKGCQEAV